MFGAWLGAALLTCRWALKTWLDIEFGFFTTKAIWLVAFAFGVTVSALFYFAFSGAALTSDDPARRRIARVELACIWLVADSAAADARAIVLPEAAFASISPATGSPG